MWTKIKTFLKGLLYVNGEPSRDSFLMIVGFLLCFIILLVCMFVAIQNSDKIISAVAAIIQTILGVKGIQSSIRNIVDSAYNSPKGEPPVPTKKNPEGGN